jgi:hypothetical protein
MKRVPRVRSTGGNASIEFALVLLPFCLLLMGMIDYGWFFFVDLVCTNAVRTGARMATTYPGAVSACSGNATATGASAAQSALIGLLPASFNPAPNCTCAMVPLVGAPTPQPQYVCTINFNFPQLTGFSLVPMPGPGGGSVNVTTSATMR